MRRDWMRTIAGKSDSFEYSSAEKCYGLNIRLNFGDWQISLFYNFFYIKLKSFLKKNENGII